MRLICRNWLRDIAADYGACAGLADRAAKDAAEAAAEESAGLLRLMPWHARFAVGCVEIAASAFCILDQVFHFGKADPARAMKNFAKVPVISAPLFRLYRSVAAATFFEQPQVLAAMGVENPDDRQGRFRQIKKKEKAA